MAHLLQLLIFNWSAETWHMENDMVNK